jgi:hypothetical protein
VSAARRRRPRFPPAPRHRLLVVFRDRCGVIGHVALGWALLDSDWSSDVSILAPIDEAPALAEFLCDTPTQAERAMDELAELGDVPFHPRDFVPRWYSPRSGSAAVAWLLARRHHRKARRVLTDEVCAELEQLQRILEDAARPGNRFHLVDVEPGEDLVFAGPRLTRGPENNPCWLSWRPCWRGETLHLRVGLC